MNETPTAATATERVSLGLPRRVAITGGASGIGLACAKLYLEAGASVGIIGRSQAKLDAAAASLADAAASGGGSIVSVAADVADEAAMAAALSDISTRIGGLDALVVSAGVALETGLLVPEASVESFRKTLEVNVLGAFIATKAALPHLANTEAATITIIGSDSGFVAVPGMVAYNASKGAIVQLTRALAVELYETHGIRVNSVAPSIVDTPMARHDLGDELMDNPNFPLQSAEDIAWSVAYLSSRRARAVNGHTMLSDFGYTGKSSFPA
ncbi:MAG: SDR family oxidoreductase [Actinobacteria bacterium]|nr:SDR family oxidoreductase [Actinomycetota bacterium]